MPALTRSVTMQNLEMDNSLEQITDNMLKHLSNNVHSELSDSNGCGTKAGTEGKLGCQPSQLIG